MKGFVTGLGLGLLLATAHCKTFAVDHLYGATLSKETFRFEDRGTHVSIYRNQK